MILKIAIPIILFGTLFLFVASPFRTTGMTTLNTEDYVIIDVRTYPEHIESRIPDSILMPYDNIENMISNQEIEKDETIVVYCRSGRRSSIAKEKLVSMGYTNVIDIGGIVDWNGPTVSGP